METIKQEACGFVFSDMDLSLPVDHFYFKRGWGWNGRKPVGLPKPQPLISHLDFWREPETTKLSKFKEGEMGLKVTPIQNPTISLYYEKKEEYGKKENPPEPVWKLAPQKRNEVWRGMNSNFPGSQTPQIMETYGWKFFLHVREIGHGWWNKMIILLFTACAFFFLLSPLHQKGPSTKRS